MEKLRKQEQARQPNSPQQPGFTDGKPDDSRRSRISHESPDHTGELEPADRNPSFLGQQRFANDSVEETTPANAKLIEVVIEFAGDMIQQFIQANHVDQEDVIQKNKNINDDDEEPWI
jgi:hypothetical protein